MAGAKQNPNCPFGGIRNYNREGRPFTMTDLNPRPLVTSTEADSTMYSTEVDTTCDSSCNRAFKPYAGEGRPFNTALDITRNRIARSQNCQMGRNSTELESTCDYSVNVGYKPGQGRPFNPALDITQNRTARSQNCPVVDSTCDYNAHKGRPFNPALDITRNRIAQASNHQTVSDKQRQINLEYEMARNKQIALERLRAEEEEKSANQPRPPLDCTKQARKAIPVCSTKGGSRGRPLDLRAEKQRQQCRIQESTYASSRSCNKRAGRPLDLDMPFSCNYATYTPPGAAGRPFDVDRDLTYRRLNLPTPKAQRATSCPTPVQNGSPHSSIQRLPRICPRSPQTVCSPLARSASPPAASGSSFNTSVTNKTQRSPTAPAGKFPVAPICRPLRTPVPPEAEEPQAMRGNVTKTVTTTTTTGPPTSQETPICPIPQQSPSKRPQNRSPCQEPSNTSYAEYEDLNLDSAIFQRPRSPLTPQLPVFTGTPSSQKTNMSFGNSIPEASITQTTNESILRSHTTDLSEKTLNTTHAPPSPPPPPPIDPNSTDCRNLRGLSRSRSCVLPSPTSNRTFEWSTISDGHDNTFDVSGDYRSQQSRVCPSPRQTRTSSECPTAQQESHYYNASMFQEPSLGNRNCPRSTRDCTDISYVDLTDETQYHWDSMDMSVQEVPCSPTPPCNRGDSRRMHSFSIPPEDMTCERSTRDGSLQQQNLNSTMLPSSPGRIAQIDEMVETDFESTQYLDLPSSFKSQPTSAMPPKTSPPCERPRASLFKCLAQKLSSTYEFISSLVASQNTADMSALSADKTPGQVCDTTTFGLNTLFKTTCPQSRTCDTRNASEYQGNNTTNFGLNTLFNTTCPQSTSCDQRNVSATQANDTTGFGIKNLFGNTTNLMNIPNSIRECANAKRCGRVQFDNTDKSQVQDANRAARRKAELEILVNDTYCPGIIQETIDGQENFNNYSLNLSHSTESPDATICECPPLEDPMTLLEAFSIRIDNERTQIHNDIPDNAKQDQIEDIIRNYFANQNPTDLNRSIKSLMLSEHLQEHEEQEKSKGISLEADVQKLITNLPDNNKIKLIVYTGRTKPAQEEAV